MGPTTALPDPAPAPGKRQGGCSPLLLPHTHPGPPNPQGGVCLPPTPAALVAAERALQKPGQQCPAHGWLWPQSSRLPQQEGFGGRSRKGTRWFTWLVTAAFIGVPEERTFTPVHQLPSLCSTQEPPPHHGTSYFIRVECLAPQVICTNYKLNQFQGEEEMRTRYPCALRYVLYDLLEPHSSSWL